MIILYIGDVMAVPGIRAVEQMIPKLRKQYAIDLVIAQAENVTNGKGLSKTDFKRLQNADIDFCTGGNWSLYNDEIFDYLADPQQPVVRPANYPDTVPGRGWKYITTRRGDVLVISLLGSIVGRDADKPTDNPLQIIDAILKENADRQRVATVVNLHGDFSSEKVIIGHYLDGRVSVVVGDHWHVPTADARILPNGTAHQTDVGMCGVLNASLGVTLDSVVPRWRDGRITKNEIAEDNLLQFNALLVDIDEATGLARTVTPIQETFEV